MTPPATKAHLVGTCYNHFVTLQNPPCKRHKNILKKQSYSGIGVIDV